MAYNHLCFISEAALDWLYIELQLTCFQGPLVTTAESIFQDQTFLEPTSETFTKTLAKPSTVMCARSLQRASMPWKCTCAPTIVRRDTSFKPKSFPCRFGRAMLSLLWKEILKKRCSYEAHQRHSWKCRQSLSLWNLPKTSKKPWRSASSHAQLSQSWQSVTAKGFSYFHL